MPEWEMVEPFEIDNGELDSLSRQQAFVLGVEWARFEAGVSQLQHGNAIAFQMAVHSDNVLRCTGLAARASCHVSQVEEQGGEWVSLMVRRGA